jgi:hypothetical protein
MFETNGKISGDDADFAKGVGPPPSKGIPLPLAMLLSGTATPTPLVSRTGSSAEATTASRSRQEFAPAHDMQEGDKYPPMDSARTHKSEASFRSDTSQPEAARYGFIQKLRTMKLREQAEALATASEARQALALDLLTSQEREAILHEIERMAEERAEARAQEERRRRQIEVEPELEDLDLLQGMGYSREQAWMIALVDAYMMRQGMSQEEAELAASKSPYIRASTSTRRALPHESIASSRTPEYAEVSNIDTHISTVHS